VKPRAPAIAPLAEQRAGADASSESTDDSPGADKPGGAAAQNTPLSGLPSRMLADESRPTASGRCFARYVLGRTRCERE
jgi:hypothetical protein